ncbi:Os07g0585500, partial [Oryza sativa Japonica Group]
VFNQFIRSPDTRGRRRRRKDELLRPATSRRRPAAARLPGEGRLPAAGVPTGRLPAGAGLPTGWVPPAAGLPSAVRAAAAPAAAAQQRPFLHGGMLGCPLLLLSPGRLLLRIEATGARELKRFVSWS